ncbi:hypothetical protein H5410_063206 [Solanum commersonii]|uniref:Uncharacterized protein n=1 Tax=Solanum commersonii TaxID=4109 RepID=A0A9J5WEL8_SOLCO|nr:hypothetical protein H5410_063206 [Solanum commersonii]
MEALFHIERFYIKKSLNIVEEIVQYQGSCPTCGILPLSVVSPDFELRLYPSITPLGGILPLSAVKPDPSTSPSLSLPGFRSNKNLNQLNRIEQVVEMKPAVKSKLTTSLSLSLL